MRDIIREIFLIIGFAAVVTGIALVYVPAALIVGGAVLVWLCAPSGKPGDKPVAKAPPSRRGGK